MTDIFIFLLCEDQVYNPTEINKNADQDEVPKQKMGNT